MKLRTALIVLKFIPAFCIVFFFQFSGFRLWANESDSILKKSAVSEISDENPVVTFSHARNYYQEPFYLSLSAIPTSKIVYTTDCSAPTANNGKVYSGPFPVDSTTIIKAIAFSGTDASQMVTNTYIFVSDVKKQAQNPTGFPETWGGSKTIPADYEMDPEVINDPEYVLEIDSAFSDLPSLSLTMDINSWFNPDTGMYVGYPNSDISREKTVTAEFIFPEETEENFAVSCGVQNQGGTSIVNWKSPKQSMRLLFKQMYGPTKLKYKLFHDSEINSINTLVVDAMLNHTWIHPNDENQRFHALYLRDQLTSDLQNDMGGLSFHGRYFHLYLNGSYWGICNLHERPDDAFLAEYLDAEREDFDIIKHNPNTVVAGTNSFYTDMLTSARNGFSEARQLKDFEKYLDIPAFIDYMLLNFYLGNYDWAQQNFYAGRNRKTTDGFRFYPWDSELVMRFADVKYDNTGKNNEGGPTEIHSLLKENEEYRMMFADAVYKHLFNDGALTPENFRKRFLFRKSEIDNAIILESARWGDYREGVSGTTYTKNEFWIQEVNRILDDYIPERRDIVIEQLRKSSNKLFPKYMPPAIETNLLEKGEIEVTINSQHESLGEVYFTLDGADPRTVGGGVRGSLYSDKINVGNTCVLKARFYSATDKSWSALAEEKFVFDDVYGENIVINEIMYHPKENYPEFIEILNFGEYPVNLKGFRFSGGINYLFRADENINPDEGLVLTNDNVLFSGVYKFSAYGQFQKNLSNSGEAIYLTNGFDQLVDSVAYSDTIPWPELADGDGYSLELINPDLDNALWSSWRVTEKINGSPYSTKSTQEMDAYIYPNPFMSEIFIEFGDENLAQESFTLEVFNQLGVKIKVIRIESFNAQVGISLASLPSGLYFFSLIPDKKSIFKPHMLKAIKLK